MHSVLDPWDAKRPVTHMIIAKSNPLQDERIQFAQQYANETDDVRGDGGDYECRGWRAFLSGDPSVFIEKALHTLF